MKKVLGVRGCGCKCTVVWVWGRPCSHGCIYGRLHGCVGARERERVGVLLSVFFDIGFFEKIILFVFSLYQQHATQHNLHSPPHTSTIRSSPIRMETSRIFERFFDTDIDVKGQSYVQFEMVPKGRYL